ncbi:MAG TPA: SseB family protein [Xanthomonadaceae bacterium]|jgi:hypothetical protein
MTDEAIPKAHEALRLAKQGKMGGKEMMDLLVAGKLYVPTSHPPQIENGVITGWRPVTASKADGSEWLLAFTTQAGASAYCDANPEHGLYISVDTPWVLRNIPEAWGIVFNLRTEDMLEWNAQGLSKYRKNVLGW